MSYGGTLRFALWRYPVHETLGGELPCCCEAKGLAGVTTQTR